jgi:type 1 glutamine amidotransferase
VRRYVRLALVAATLVMTAFPVRAALRHSSGQALRQGSGQAAKRIVLLAGRPSHGPGQHEFRAGCMLLQKALAGFPGVTVEVYTMGWPTKTVDGKTVDDNTPLENADAILIYADGGRGNPAIQGNRIQLLDTLAKKGVGLGFAHYGVEVPAGSAGEAMQRWIGGYYETNWSVNPMWAPPITTLPDHPVTRGVKPFSTNDEWYFNMRWTPDAALKARITPILVATPSDEVRKGPYVSPRGPYDHIIADSGKAETMMWVMDRPDGGRSFGFTGGHTHTHWGDPNQRRVMLNALLWIAKVDVPPGGVEDTITAADLAANLDDKSRRQ